VAENTLGYIVKKVRNGWYDKECKEELEVQNCAHLHMLQRKTRGNIQTYKDVQKEARKYVGGRKDCTKKKN
jgi:hypothetical protein